MFYKFNNMKHYYINKTCFNSCFPQDGKKGMQVSKPKLIFCYMYLKIFNLWIQAKIVFNVSTECDFMLVSVLFCKQNQSLIFSVYKISNTTVIKQNIALFALLTFNLQCYFLVLFCSNYCQFP